MEPVFPDGVLIEKKSFIWKMKFPKLLDRPQKNKLYSPHFVLGECEWKLSLNVRVAEFGVFLHLIKFKNQNSLNGSPEIQATFRIKVEIESKNLKDEGTTSWIWGLPSAGYGFPSILLFDPKSVGKNDVLLVKCKIWTKNEPGDGTASQRINQNTRSSLCVQIQGLLDDSILTDLTIQVGGEHLKAHKSIMAARSPVFRRMFESRMVEAAKSQLIIQDFSAKVVQQMLEFMYSGDESLVGKNGVPLTELLQISEKYAFEHLKDVCEVLLGNKLNMDNVIEMLILADMQNAPTLKDHTIEYIVKNSVEVLKTKAYLQLKSVEIIKEICSALANENSKLA